MIDVGEVNVAYLDPHQEVGQVVVDARKMVLSVIAG
jgi:hypothetical protein